MDSIWQVVGFVAGIVALLLLLELMDLPEWIGTYLKQRTPRKKLEQRVADLQNRVCELEGKIKS